MGKEGRGRRNDEGKVARRLVVKEGEGSKEDGKSDRRWGRRGWGSWSGPLGRMEGEERGCERRGERGEGGR